jgi:hypothetical protein
LSLGYTVTSFPRPNCWTHGLFTGKLVEV